METNGKTMDEICRELYKQTSLYLFDGVRINEDGSLTKIRSQAYMDKHPDAERETNEIFTKEDIEYLNNIVQQLLKKEKEDGKT